MPASTFVMPEASSRRRLPCSTSAAGGWALYKRLPCTRTTALQDYTNKQRNSSHTPRRYRTCLPLALTHAIFDEHRVVYQVVGHDPHPAIISCTASPRPSSNCLDRPTGALLGSSHTLLQSSARMDGGRHISHAGPDVESYRSDMANR